LIQYNEGNENYAANAAECDKKLIRYEKNGKLSGYGCRDSGNQCKIIISGEDVTIQICS
jgi:hypothetical protein